VRAITQPRYGGPNGVELADVPVPTPGAGQVLVRVHASSVNAADIEIIEAGSVQPIIDRTYPLEEAAAALRYVEAGLAQGKVVIAIAPSA
jgi:NADPH:quinone reductase-like Zn-dependent oxidoreductase